MKLKTLNITWLFLFCSFMANAQLEFCNRTSEKIGVAYAYSYNSQWISKGWYWVYPGECETLVRSSIASKHYYYRASSSDGGKWAGDYYFCTDSDAFEIYGDNDCVSRGYKSEGFIKVYTTSSSSTRNLIDNKDDLDKYYQGLILGTWELSEYEDGVSVTLKTTYTKNGKFTMSGSVSFDSNTYPIIGSGSWYISDGYLTEKILSSNVSEIFPNGLTTTDRIVEMTTGKIKLYSSMDQEYYTAYYDQ